MSAAGRPPVAILCGGRGTRLREHAQEIPKPLVEVGGLPIVWHVVQLYAVHGFERFLLCTGYRGELIERFVRGAPWPSGVSVECVDTGLDTPTGGRLKMLEERLREYRPSSSAALAGQSDGEGTVGQAEGDGAGCFCATYADGLASVDLGLLLRFHASHGALATMTVVQPELQFGVTQLGGEDGRVVTGFQEKPRSEHWINGGFFCFEQDVFGYLSADSVLEREPLQRLAADGQLRAHRHEGFWECMDTYKDAVALNDLWASGRPPWRSRQ